MAETHAQKQTNERKALGLPLLTEPPKPPQTQSTLQTRRRTTRNNKQSAVTDPDYQVALALSVSLKESEEKKRLASENYLIEIGLTEEVEELRKSKDKDKTTIPSTIPVVLKPTTTSRRHKQQLNTVTPVLLTMTQSERDQIINEKVAEVLFSQDEIVICDEQVEINCCTSLEGFRDNDCTFWNATSLMETCVPNKQIFYTENLSNVISPQKHTEGTKLKRLSQIPGRGKSPKKVEIITKANIKTPVKKLSFSEIPTKKSTHLADLACDWLHLVNNSLLSDLTIYCRHEEKLVAHRLVLTARCPLVLNDVITEKSKSGEKHMLMWYDIGKKSALVVLEFVYGGKEPSFEDNNKQEVIELCERYNITGLLDLMKDRNVAEHKNDDFELLPSQGGFFMQANETVGMTTESMLPRDTIVDNSDLFEAPSPVLDCGKIDSSFDNENNALLDKGNNVSFDKGNNITFNEENNASFDKENNESFNKGNNVSAESADVAFDDSEVISASPDIFTEETLKLDEKSPEIITLLSDDSSDNNKSQKDEGEQSVQRNNVTSNDSVLNQATLIVVNESVCNHSEMVDNNISSNDNNLSVLYDSTDSLDKKFNISSKRRRHSSVDLFDSADDETSPLSKRSKLSDPNESIVNVDLSLMETDTATTNQTDVWNHCFDHEVHNDFDYIGDVPNLSFWKSSPVKTPVCSPAKSVSKINLTKSPKLLSSPEQNYIAACSQTKSNTPSPIKINSLNHELKLTSPIKLKDSSYFQSSSQQKSSQKINESDLRILNDTNIWSETNFTIVAEKLPSPRATTPKKRTKASSQQLKTKTSQKTVSVVPKKTTAKSKSPPVTPMPEYSLMETPQIKKELKKYGIKPLAKKRAKQVLKHIYNETHPIVTSEETNDLRPESPSTEEEPLPLSQDSMTSQDSSLAEETFHCDDNLDFLDCNDYDDIPNQIRQYIVNNKDLHENVLKYEPIPLEQLFAELKENGVKCKIKHLMDYLDEQCITFRMMKTSRRRQKGPKKKK